MSIGRFWFGSHQEGVCMFDGSEFIYYTVSDGLSDNQVRTIQEDQAGVMWFGTGDGITSFDGNAFKIRTGRNAGIPDITPGDSWHKEAGDLWFPGDSRTRSGSAGQGAYRYDGRSLSYLALPLPHGVAASGSLGRIFSIAEDAAGSIWFGTRDNGAWRYNGASLTNFTIEDGLTSHMVWTIYRDKRDALWFGMGDGSVCRFNGASFDRMY